MTPFDLAGRGGEVSTGRMGWEGKLSGVPKHGGKLWVKRLKVEVSPIARGHRD